MIKNRLELLENALTPDLKAWRSLLVEGIEYALKAAHPLNFLREHVAVTDGKLRIDGGVWELDSFKRVFILGAGKASGHLAEGVEQLLGDKITEGYVNVPRGTKPLFKTRIIKLNEAGHPIPDEEGLRGAEKMIEVAVGAEKRDLIICLISGGGSSLLPLPAEGLTLEEKRLITDKMILSGATIHEINTVRKHLSRIKGGWLAKKASPATVISLIISDVVGDRVDVIASGPTSPDESTYMEAVKILRRYGLWNDLTNTVKEFLTKGVEGILPETPKPEDPCFKSVYNYIVGSNLEICLELKRFYKKRGCNSIVLTSRMEGEAREVGKLLSSIALEATSSGNPLKPPLALICGGETTVTVRGGGKGGRNQELALAASTRISNQVPILMASFGTDGVDGPTEAAGAVIDHTTIKRAEERGLRAEDYLLNNDSYTFFENLGDLIICGPTGTNVNDISLILIPS
ncbi:MAG: glycerate kinase [Candidatus Bathyarchaeia archaeon]